MTTTWTVPRFVRPTSLRSSKTLVCSTSSAQSSSHLLPLDCQLLSSLSSNSVRNFAQSFVIFSQPFKVEFSQDQSSELVQEIAQALNIPVDALQVVLIEVDEQGLAIVSVEIQLITAEEAAQQLINAITGDGSSLCASKMNSFGHSPHKITPRQGDLLRKALDAGFTREDFSEKQISCTGKSAAWISTIFALSFSIGM